MKTEKQCRVLSAVQKPRHKSRKKQVKSEPKIGTQLLNWILVLSFNFKANNRRKH